jgi:hypothetical protein
MVPLYFGLEELFPMGAEPLESACVVLLHESAVADDVGGEDGREAAFHCRFLPQ